MANKVGAGTHVSPDPCDLHVAVARLQEALAGSRVLIVSSKARLGSRVSKALLRSMNLFMYLFTRLSPKKKKLIIIKIMMLYR